MLVNNVIGTSEFSNKDFEVVAIGVYDDTYVPAVHEDAPYANLKEFIEDAKKSPGKVDGGAPARNAALLAKKMEINAGPYGSMKSCFDRRRCENELILCSLKGRTRLLLLPVFASYDSITALKYSLWFGCSKSSKTLKN